MYKLTSRRNRAAAADWLRGRPGAACRAGPWKRGLGYLDGVTGPAAGPGLGRRVTAPRCAVAAPGRDTDAVIGGIGSDAEWRTVLSGLGLVRAVRRHSDPPVSSQVWFVAARRRRTL